MLVATVPAERQVLLRSNDALIRFEWNVNARLWTKIALGQTEVDQVDCIGLFPLTDYYVFRLHVTVHEVF